jgi:hypothetical protein
MTEPKRKLKIDLGELAFAFDSGFGETSYYLDLETGNVVVVTDDTSLELATLREELDENASPGIILVAIQDHDMLDWQKDALLEAIQIEMDPESRYLPVPHDDSHEGYRDMESFIETVEDEHLCELLEFAIQGRGAFGRFKGALARYPEERERWFRFKDDRLRQRVLDWLDSEGIEPEAH